MAGQDEDADREARVDGADDGSRVVVAEDLGGGLAGERPASGAPL
jgi:hypothetical protein